MQGQVDGRSGQVVAKIPVLSDANNTSGATAEVIIASTNREVTDFLNTNLAGTYCLEF